MKTTFDASFNAVIAGQVQLVAQTVAMFKGLPKINWSLKWLLVIQLVSHAVAQEVAQAAAQPVAGFKGEPPRMSNETNLFS